MTSIYVRTIPILVIAATAFANRDALGNIIEITGTADPNSQANRGGATKFGIVEAEFYETLKVN